MTAGRQFAIFWPLGLVAFAMVIIISMPLSIEAVPRGIVAHQVAGSAAAIDAIHAAWARAGLMRHAEIAMQADLLFIGIYSYGCWQGGRALMQRDGGKLRLLGLAVILAALTFCVTDYGETIAQIMQLNANAGSDRLASIAATLNPIKTFAFIAATVGIIAGMLLTRFTQRRT